MKENDVIISVESFFQQKPSIESIQALEDSVLHYIDYNELQNLYRNFSEFNFIGRVLAEKYYMLSEQRLYSLLMQHGQDRYDYLLEHHPELILRVPAKYLASYLGISEVHFSLMIYNSQTRCLVGGHVANQTLVSFFMSNFSKFFTH